MASRPRSILVIDNDADFLLFMSDLLTDEGHRVETANSIEAARLLLNATRPEVIISDLLIWGHNQAAAAGQLLSEPLLAGIPMLICSGAHYQLDTISGLNRPGGVEILGKPFTIDDLLERLEQLIDTGDELGLFGDSVD